MRLQERAQLQGLNSFNVASSARLLVEIEHEEDVLEAPLFDPDSDLVLGGGSNVLLASDVPGTVYLNRIRGRHVLSQDDDSVWIEAGAGENWHDLVAWTLQRGWAGIENLSLIPGLVGAAPIQNIGAYGVELASVLEYVTAWDWHKARWVRIERCECGFAYRDSRFKSAEAGRYFITSVGLRLSHHCDPQLHYQGLNDALGDLAGRSPTAAEVSQAVIALRRAKLPDPAVTPNAGSFFKNPVIPADMATSLSEQHSTLPVWPYSESKAKVSAAWLIEHCGLKGLRRGDAAVSEQHALVLVNLGRASGRDLLSLSRTVAESVKSSYGIELETEPTIVDFTTPSRKG